MYVEQPLLVTAAALSAFRALSRAVDVKPGPGGSRITPIANASAWYEALGPEFGSRSPALAIVALYPSSQLVAHCDPPINAIRYHVPLVVNTGCWVFHDGAWQQLEVGRVYRMDPTQIHGAVNWGTEVRLHLILDVKE